MAYLGRLWDGFLILGLLLFIDACTGQFPSIQLDDDDLDIGLPGRLPPGISPPGGSPSGGCCAGLPVATPMPDIPFPICPGGLPPLFSPDGGGTALACLPTSDTCPPRSSCWYNGIDYYCCPMDPAPGYGPAPRPPISEYGGGGRPRPPGRVNPPGKLPIGVNPPSDSSEISAPGSAPLGISPPGDSSEITAPGSAPRGINPPGDSGEDTGAPGSFPKGINPPSDSGEIPGSVPRGIRPPSAGGRINPPGGLPRGVRPPGGNNGPARYPWKKKPKLQPPPFGDGTFPNPFTCCGGGGFHPPANLPRNINAPSERAIGFIQFFGGHNIWPPKETGKAKFGGPIKPDFLWFPGQHPPHLSNELPGCCGGGGGYGDKPSQPAGYGRPQNDVALPKK